MGADEGTTADAGDAFLQEDFPRAPAPDAAWSFNAIVPVTHAVAPQHYVFITFPRGAAAQARPGVTFGLDRPPR